jgi:hypothetical protein
MEALLAPGPVDSPWRFAEEVWTRCNRHLLELERTHPERCLRVGYEALVRDPEEQMRRVSEFLELSFDSALLDPYSGGRMIDGPGDPDIFQHDTIDAALADAWRSVELPQPLAPETLEVAARLGYEAPAPGAATGGGSPATPRRVVPTDPRDANLLLDRLNDLSDDEVEATLSALLGEDADA